MSRDGLLTRLKALRNALDIEAAHGEADRLLVEYIADEEIAAAYEALDRWYA